MRYFLPYCIAFVIGHLVLKITMRTNDRFDGNLRSFISLGLGLGICGHLTFYSFLLFDRFNGGFLITAGLIILALLLCINAYAIHINLVPNINLKKINLKLLGPTLFVAIVSIPLVIEAYSYPFGGWDAWSVWNLKARFLFLGGENWRNLFDPLLWRSSPHYPLLLPLINAWSWVLSKNPVNAVPLWTALIFSVSTVGLLFSGLKIYVKKLPATLGVLLIATIPFFITVATSQYSDIVLAYYLLGSFICLLQAYSKHSAPFGLLGGIFLGFLSFTKPEGTVAAGIMAALIILYLLFFQKARRQDQKRLLVYFLIGLFVASMPTIISQLFLAPANQTFTNGFASASDPVTFNRLKIIGGFFFFELTSKKWNGVWILLLLGLIISGRRSISRDIIIIPVFLVLYLLTVGFYYFLNTYFDIVWWLSVTLRRILFTLLPVIALWVFCAVWRDAAGNTRGVRT